LPAVSALDVERVLLEHPAIAECAVVGLPDPAFGQTITAVVVLKQVPLCLSPRGSLSGHR
jgi:acyl-coenzyme A synthetase/AMP-(fatty) acid ligase